MTPFKTPIRVQDKCFLVAADHELILEAHAATPEELAEIVKRVNAYGEFLKLKEGIKCLKSYAANVEDCGEEALADYIDRFLLELNKILEMK